MGALKLRPCGIWKAAVVIVCSLKLNDHVLLTLVVPGTTDEGAA